MKNTFVTILVLGVLLVGGWFFLGQGGSVEAPTLDDSNELTKVDADTMPVPGHDVDEMMVSDEAGDAMMQEVREFTVSGKNFSFEPALVTVKKGDKVKITFDNTSGFHDFMIDEYSVATTQASSPNMQSVEFVADKAGDFEFYCSVGNHRAQGMVGTLRVE